MKVYEPTPFAPLPGTIPAPRGLFIDRWGTLLVEPEGPRRGLSADDVRFHEGVLDALFRAHRAGWFVYVVGNEDHVAFGHTSDEQWCGIESRYLGELASHGVPVKRQYACLDNPEGVDGHRHDSAFLLPNTGLFFHAAHNDGIAVEKSWVIGDSTCELVAGWRAGMRIAGVQTGQALRDGTYHVEPDFLSDSLADAVLGVLGQRAVELH